jgi:hypothetical protein
VYEIFARIVVSSYKSHALAALPVIMFLLLNFSNVTSRHQNANQVQTWYGLQSSLSILCFCVILSKYTKYTELYGQDNLNKDIIIIKLQT